MEGRDGAADDGFLVGRRDAGAGFLAEEVFAGRIDAAVGAPEVMNDGRDEAVVHVAGNDEIKISKEWCDFGVVEIVWRMNQGDFGFAAGKVVELFCGDIVQVIQQHIFVLVAGMEEGCRVAVVVKLIIIWRNGEAKDIDLFIFVGGVVQAVDVGELV